MKAVTKRNSEQSFSSNEKTVLRYAQALRLLKQTEERLQKRKKQIKAQGMKSERGKWHAEEQEKKVQIRNEIKNQNLKLQSQFQMMRAKQLQKIARLKKESEAKRQESLKKRSMSRLQLLQNKIRLNRDIREQSLHQTQKIIHMREQQLQKKRQHRLSMYGSRVQMRKSVEQFQASRIKQIRNSNSRERDQLLQKLKSREKELSELDRIQTETSRVKVEKEHSTAQNIKSIDQSMRIYNPHSKRKERKRSLSDYRFFKEGGTMITEI